MAERAAAHEDRNLARMLTPAERRRVARRPARRGWGCPGGGGSVAILARTLQRHELLLRSQPVCCPGKGPGGCAGVHHRRLRRSQVLLRRLTLWVALPPPPQGEEAEEADWRGGGGDVRGAVQGEPGRARTGPAGCEACGVRPAPGRPWVPHPQPLQWACTAHQLALAARSAGTQLSVKHGPQNPQKARPTDALQVGDLSSGQLRFKVGSQPSRILFLC